MNFKAGIFDMDGIVIDTVPFHFEAWKKMFSEYGKAFTFDDYKQKVDGIPRIDGARAILADLSPEGLKKATDTKQKYFLELLDKEKIPVFQSTVRLIEEIRERGIKTAIITSSKNCSYILKKAKLEYLFDAKVDGNDITKGKPDPQIFLMAADKLSAKNKGCIVFEDAVLGVEAAKRAGMMCVGVDRYGKPERLSKADIVVSDLKEMNLGKLTAMAGSA
ncbi:MAG: beta-phosphoglucomutase family hydrolase [Endomicrobiales bacterium]|nr:beta-phosphoglucomutase family hydrolase [Endomicrobiales bacterium]